MNTNQIYNNLKGIKGFKEIPIHNNIKVGDYSRLKMNVGLFISFECISISNEKYVILSKRVFNKIYNSIAMTDYNQFSFLYTVNKKKEKHKVSTFAMRNW
jgi:hypothetical protein